MPIRVTIDTDKFHTKMVMGRRSFPDVARKLVVRLGYELERLMKRTPPVPVRTGRLRASIHCEFPGQFTAFVAPHTDYAEAMNNKYHYVTDAADALAAKAEAIVHDELRKWDVEGVP